FSTAEGAMTTTHAISTGTCIVRDTASKKGRTTSVSPGTAASRHLFYGRIILDGGDAPIAFDTNDRETGLVCLKGSAAVKVGGETHTLDRFDAIYTPRDSRVSVTPGGGGCDLAEISAPVTVRHPVQFVAF